MNKKMRMSLGSKAILVIMAVSVIIVLTCILVSYSTYSNTINEYYRQMTKNIGRTAATRLDGDRLDGYLESKVKDDEYYRMLSDLFDIKNNNDILYLYVIKVTNDSVYYIIDADIGETACELGERFDIADEFRPYVGRLENGTPALITKSEFGWLCTGHSPVFNSMGEVTALVGVDISMNEVMQEKFTFLALIVISTVSAALLLTLVTLKLISKCIIKPINQLTIAAGKYIDEKNEGLPGELSSIANLDIHTGDELESLSNSIKAMDHDLNVYIENLTHLNMEKERMSTILSVANSIQSSMLPCIFPAFPEREEFDLHASILPAKEVNGDFYDFFLIDETHLGIVIADVSGKGVPATLFMVIAKTLIRNQALYHKSPAEIFTIVNAQLCQSNKSNLFVTAFIGVVNLQSGIMEYANAGHGFPLVYKESKGFYWLKSQPGFVLAGIPEINYKQYSLQLTPGDRLLLYTDGVTEILNEQNQCYGATRLFEALNQPSMREVSIAQLDEMLQEDLRRFIGKAEQEKDITILVLEFREYYQNRK